MDMIVEMQVTEMLTWNFARSVTYLKPDAHYTAAAVMGNSPAAPPTTPQTGNYFLSTKAVATVRMQNAKTH